MLRDLRFGRWWLVLGWIAIITALTVCLLPPKYVEVPGANDKVEHIIGFVLLTLWFCGIYARSRYWLIALSYLLFGVFIEVLQGAMHLGRNSDIHDVYADAVGIFLGIILALTPLGRWPRKVEGWVEGLFARK